MNDKEHSTSSSSAAARRLRRRDPRRAARACRLHRRLEERGGQARVRRHLPERRLHPVESAARVVASSTTARHEFEAHGIKVGGLEIDVERDAWPQGRIVKQLTAGIEPLFKANSVTRSHGSRQAAAGQRVEVTDGTTAACRRSTATHVVLATGLGADRAAVREIRRQAHRRLRRRARFRRRAEAPRRDRRRRDRPRARQRLAAARLRGHDPRSAADFLAMADAADREGSAARTSRSRASTSGSARRSRAPRSRATSATSPTRWAGEQTLVVDALLVAVGRRAVHRRAARATARGVQLDERGLIEVDEHCRTRRRTSGPSATSCAGRCSRTRASRKASWSPSSSPAMPAK